MMCFSDPCDVSDDVISSHTWGLSDFVMHQTHFEDVKNSAVCIWLSKHNFYCYAVYYTHKRNCATSGGVFFQIMSTSTSNSKNIHSWFHRWCLCLELHYKIHYFIHGFWRSISSSGGSDWDRKQWTSNYPCFCGLQSVSIQIVTPKLACKIAKTAKKISTSKIWPRFCYNR